MSQHTLSSLLALAATDEGKQQIRVMVAEACGWCWQHFVGAAESFLEHPNKPYRVYDGPRMEVALPCSVLTWMALDGWGVPDFTGSLDAMAEALKSKDDAFMREFQHHSLETYRPEFNNLGIDAPRRHSFQSYAIFRSLKPDAWRWAVAFILASGQGEQA